MPFTRMRKEEDEPKSVATQFRNLLGIHIFGGGRRYIPTSPNEKPRDVKLEEEGYGLVFVKPTRKILHIHEIIMNASLLDKCTLRIGNQSIHERREANGQHLGDDFGDGVDKADRPIVGDPLGALLLGQ